MIAALAPIPITLPRLDCGTASLPDALESGGRDGLRGIGNPDALGPESLALFCSARCPGDVILKTFDLARALRDADRSVIGGFHTPMEKECLRLLLRGEQQIVVCPARSIDNMRIPGLWRPALDIGRLLILSSFPPARRRPTTASCAKRSESVAQLSNRVLVAHASPGSRTEALARRVAQSGKCLLTLDSPSNANLIDMGAEIADPISIG